MRQSNNQQTEKTFRIRDSTVAVVDRVKLKESEKKDKYQDLTWELKKLLNMKVTVIPFVVAAPGTVTKGLLTDWRAWK